MFEEYHDILTVDEMMEILFISRNTAYDLLRKGHIRAFKVGTTWRISKVALEEYVGYRKNAILPTYQKRRP